MPMTFTGERYVPELRGQIYYEHLHRYALALALAHDKDVLDIASGEGYGAGFLALVARSVIGVDIDAASVDYAAARYTAMNLRFLKGSAVQIPVADASIDVVVSFETIEHLVEQERMLAEIRRVLRDDGHIIISSPNKLVYSDARDYRNPFHVRELYFDEFRDLLRAFFPEVRIFGQRIFAGSAVHPLGGTSPASRWLGPSIDSQKGITALADPEYFIAVCACRPGSEIPDLASVYLDPRDDLLTDIRSGGLAEQATSITAQAPSITAQAPSIEGNSSPLPALPNRAGRALVEGSPAATLRSQLEQAQSAVAEAQAESAMLRAELEHVREYAANESRNASRAAAEARLVHENLEDEMRNLKAVREQLQERETGYVSLLTMLSTLRSALSVAKANSDATLEQLAATQKLLDETHSSNSWRLLAPARKAARKLRSLSFASKR